MLLRSSLKFSKKSPNDEKAPRRPLNAVQAQKRWQKKYRLIDTCVIRTHAPEGIALAGQRVNHSAKVPRLDQMIAN